MKIIENPFEMQKICSQIRLEGKTLGFVPTMGALHQGHMSLVKESKRENEITVVSIFVNPIQFGPNEDLGKYPRTFKEDCRMLEEEGVDFLFFPASEAMYGKSFETYVELLKLPDHLCGLSREGHFRGVTTVVTKLFNIVKPVSAYFGKKDYQQALIIKKMAEDLNMDIMIKTVPIVRENDGLAMSSRNKYLKELERKDAAKLYQALQLALKIVSEGGRKSADIIGQMEKFILKEIPYAKIDYISIADPETLEALDVIREKAVAALAVFVSNVRLIDNIEIDISLM